jgi:hypothetical protein
MERWGAMERHWTATVVRNQVKTRNIGLWNSKKNRALMVYAQQGCKLKKETRKFSGSPINAEFTTL